MKTNLIVVVILLGAVFSSCSSSKILPGYLPDPEDIDVNRYGSYIRVLGTDRSIIQGELIAIDTNNIIVLKDSSFLKKAISIPVKEVFRFELRYAKHKDYGMTIPFYSLSTIFPFPGPAGGMMTFHGYLSAITLPINLIVTIAVTRSSATAFLYSNKEMTYEKLKMFARFPQGVPSNLDLATIK